MLKITTKKLCRSGIIAGLYIVLSLCTFPIASGAIQLRVSEALTLLPLFFPEAVVALFVGCLLCNLITGCAVFDVILGSLVTLVAGVLTFAVGKFIKRTWLQVSVGGLFPVLLNAFLLPLIWLLCYGVLEQVYYIQALMLVVSQSLAIYGLGIPMYVAIVKMKNRGVAFFSN